MAALARNTAWSEHYILWELPLARALQYQHAEWCRQAVPCYLPGDGGREAARERFEALRGEFQDGAAEDSTSGPQMEDCPVEGGVELF